MKKKERKELFEEFFPAIEEMEKIREKKVKLKTPLLKTNKLKILIYALWIILVAYTILALLGIFPIF